MSLRRSLTFIFALAVAALALGTATPAGAVDNPDYTAPAPTTVVVPSSVQAETTPTPVEVRQVTAVPAANQRLAITGSDSAQMAMVGAALLGVGGVVMVLRRRVAA